MATLKVMRDEAQRLLDERIVSGKEVLEAANQIGDEHRYEDWKLVRTRWIKLTSQVLKYIYSDDGVAEEFDRSVYRGVFVIADWPQYLLDDCRDIREGINTLKSFLDRLAFDDELVPAASGAFSEPDPSTGAAVIFLVHGRDIGRREEVARFLEKAGDHEVVILDEQASRGRTLLEKLEEHAADAKYAIVLLTGDDVGGPKNASVQQPRPRQNVVFELGWFCGQIGRKNVTVLYESGVERPSDIDGLVYVDMRNDWRRRLVRELKASGLDLSLDRV